MLTLKKQTSYCGRLVRVDCLGLDLSFIFVGTLIGEVNSQQILMTFYRPFTVQILLMKFQCSIVRPFIFLNFLPSPYPIAEQVKLNSSVLKTLSSTIEELRFLHLVISNRHQPPVVAMLLQCPLESSLQLHPTLL